jgi:DNA-binding LacI/PurR family transcriptional regulator
VVLHLARSGAWNRSGAALRAVGIKQVAAHAGVAVGTVSNVLNRPEVVAPATRKRVLDAIDELGFVRNESARTLRSGKSRTIALVVLDAGNPFFADIASGVEPVADELGSILVICDTAGDLRRERRYLAQLEEQQVQGILITPGGDDNQALLRLSERGTPVVLVDSGTLRHRSCSVSVDDVLGGRLAVDHLVETGRYRIAVVGGNEHIRQVRDRREGAALTAEESAVPVELITMDSPALSIAAGRELGTQIAALPDEERPTGVFCANDLLALGVIQQLSRHGLRVPIDLGVIGYDDIEFAEAAMTPLSSLRQPRAELGQTAAKLLVDELEEGTLHRHRHRQVIFAPELVARESTAVRRRTRARNVRQ